jgi:signal transduction histidine kinase
MGTVIRAADWSDTPLGVLESWPQSLRTTVSICLNSRFPTVIYWGPELATIYNDGYAPILGTKHPWALGRPVREVWSEIWSVIEPMMKGVVSTGVATWSEDQLLNMNRKGYVEECYFTYSFGPVAIESGETGGIFACVVETTGRVLGERRLRTLRELGQALSGSTTVEQTCAAAARAVCRDVADVPFALLYLVDADGKEAQLASACGLEAGHASSPLVVGLDDDRAAWPLARVARTGVEEVLSDLPERFGHLSGGAWSESARSAVVLPIAHPGQERPYGLLIVGVSPRRALDENYRTFFKLAAGQIATSLSNARAYEEERKRAEALTEIDRAKTAFFNNVSHEFRTPLTLMLGPLEDELAERAEPLPPARRQRLETAHRNSLRLLKLVNTLLDFSRLEAGRVQATYEPVDLGLLTAELASVFRAAVEKAGMTLTVECAALPEPVYVDREMWEKIVFNLISNALKHTFAGGIRVALAWRGDAAELAVSDSGVGIPEDEIPRLFERFHRVKGARSRSHEGTGIGLALVQELVRAHGGTVEVASVVGSGSTFRVTVRAGLAHLPSDRTAAARTVAATDSRASAYLQQALHWLPDDPDELDTVAPVGRGDPETVSPDGSTEPAPRARILWADDNADMRDYVRRLLADRYDVHAVPDGAAALAAARAEPPDLVLTDVMMPGLDGFGLLRELRADPRTRTVPVILLSARAGEESAVEGLQAGADDYLVKPFSARELLARVRTHVDLARLRRVWSRQLEDAIKELEAFSYSVSHDLRAPLRSIDGFSKALLARHAEQLDTQGRSYLERVRAATARMSTLIDDLLDLSRISRGPLRRKSVSLTDVATTIVAELHRQHTTREVIVDIQDGLTAQADARLTAVILENLIGNAWKFTGRRAQAHVSIGRTIADGTAAFFVRDDGAGFDSTYASSLFQPFQRLHGDSEFEGSGIGLATVRRIVARHDGRVWAESEVDRGAVFFFTLGGER